MDNKKIRYCTRVFPLDRINHSFSYWYFDQDKYLDVLEVHNKNYGLHLISQEKELSIIMEYSNIIWNYKVFYGSCKKRYKPLIFDDDRWIIIEEDIDEDLKLMGLESLKDDVINSLKRKEYFEYNEKRDIQFKKYCVKE